MKLRAKIQPAVPNRVKLKVHLKYQFNRLFGMFCNLSPGELAFLDSDKKNGCSCLSSV